MRIPGQLLWEAYTLAGLAACLAGMNVPVTGAVTAVGR